MTPHNSKDFFAITVIIIILIMFCAPLMVRLNYVSLDDDWGQIYSYCAAARKAILLQHQFPLRTPYFAGGYPLLANPQDGSLSPLLLFIILFGEIIGTKIICIAGYIACAVGMYYLVRRIFAFSIAGASFSALLVSLNGWLPYQLHEGNFTKVYYYFMPLLIFLFLKGKNDRRYLFICCLLTSVILFQAGLGFIACSLFLFLFVLCEAEGKMGKHIWKAKANCLALFILLMTMTLLIGAVKILPMLQLLKNSTSPAPAEIPKYFYYDLNTFFKAFSQKHYLNGGAIYLGYFPIALCIASLIIFWRKLAKYFILLLVIIFICFAHNAPIDIFGLIHRLPIVNYMAKPSKYFSFFIVFLISFIGGHFFLWIEKSHLIKKSIKYPLMCLLFSYPVLNLFFVNIYFHQRIFKTKYDLPQNNFSFCQSKAINLENKWDVGFLQYDLINRNVGLINWYGDIDLPENAEPKFIIDLKDREGPRFSGNWKINSSYRGELYFIKSANRAFFDYFSPNKLIISADVSAPDRLVINQNYDRYWKVSKGMIENYSGLLSVISLPEGSYEIELDYRPVNFYVGLGISAIFFIIFSLSCFYGKIFRMGRTK